MRKVLVILGPTATGKTDVALQLARKFHGELVSCDSRQVYVGLDIGTGKEPGKSIKEQVLRVKKQKGYWEIDGTKIWLYDVADPREQYTVKDYVEQASQVVEDITQRGKLPIIVGGTGLYLKALLEGLPNLNIPVDEKLRRELQKLSLEELQEKLRSLSPAKWKKLNESDKKNPRRLLRSIEILSMYPHNKTIKNLKLKIRHHSFGGKNYNILKLGLTAPRDTLNKRIPSRLISRVDQGLIQEAERLHKNGLTLERMKELGLEYGILAKLLAKEISKDQFISILSVKIYQYAKRQITWFKREKDTQWFDITEDNWNKKLEKLVTSWYH